MVQAIELTEVIVLGQQPVPLFSVHKKRMSTESHLTHKSAPRLPSSLSFIRSLLFFIASTCCRASLPFLLPLAPLQVRRSCTIQSDAHPLTPSKSRNLYLSSALLVNALKAIQILLVSYHPATESPSLSSHSSRQHSVSTRRLYSCASAPRAICFFDEPTTSS